MLKKCHKYYGENCRSQNFQAVLVEPTMQTNKNLIIWTLTSDQAQELLYTLCMRKLKQLSQNNQERKKKTVLKE